MALKDWLGFRTQKKKEVPDMTRDEEEIKKAEEDVGKKGGDSQTEKDRIDESVGEQEAESGTRDSQTAKDRIDESEGTKEADEKREEGESRSLEEILNPLKEEIAALKKEIEALRGTPRPADEETSSRLETAKRIFNN